MIPFKLKKMPAHIHLMHAQLHLSFIKNNFERQQKKEFFTKKAVML